MRPTEAVSGPDYAGTALKKATDEELPRSALRLRRLQYAANSLVVFILEFGHSQAETPSALTYFVSFRFSHITPSRKSIVSCRSLLITIDPSI